MLQFDDEEKGEMKAKKKKRCNYVSIEVSHFSNAVNYRYIFLERGLEQQCLNTNHH